MTRKIRGFLADKRPKPRFGCIFIRKTQPNHGFGPPAGAKPRILRLRSASRLSCLASLLAPRSSLPRVAPPFFAPPCSVASLLAPRSFLPSAPLSRLAPPFFGSPCSLASLLAPRSCHPSALLPRLDPPAPAPSLRALLLAPSLASLLAPRRSSPLPSSPLLSRNFRCYE